MRLSSQVLCIAVIIAAARTLWADTVTLQTGGKVDGTINELVFLQGGARKTYRQDEFTALTINKERADALLLKNGSSLKGELVSLEIKCIGGLLSFARADVTEVSLGPTRTDEAWKEYKDKRAEVKDDDAAGLYQLAVWCQDNGIKVQMRDLARLCLKANPPEETAVLAHRLLGHVLKDGQWVEPGPPDDKPKDDPQEPKLDTEAAKKVDPALAQLYRTLAQTYTQKAEEMRTKDWDTIKTTYSDQWDKLGLLIKKCKTDYDKAEQKRIQVRDDRAAEARLGTYTTTPTTYEAQVHRDRINQLNQDYDRAVADANKVNASLQQANRDRLALASKIKAAQNKATSRADDRDQKLAVAKSRIERLLIEGKKLTDAEMTAIFDQALKD